MLMNFEKTAELIENGKLLHIAATEGLLRKLPRGNWIGGSTEYFMDAEGMICGEQLFVTQLDYADFVIKTYDTATIANAPRAHMVRVCLLYGSLGVMTYSTTSYGCCTAVVH